MVDNKIKLTVLNEPTAAAFTDISSQCHDFSRDAVSVTMTATTSHVYVGYYKPINSIYIDFTTPNTNTSVLTVEKYNGAYTAVASLQDDSKGLSRNGFINWNRATDEVAVTVNSTTLFWYKLTISVTTSAMSINGISFLFADDQDLKQEVPEIADTNHLAGKASHVLTHIAVRNQIIQDLRNKDYTHTNQSTGVKENLTVWDILDANQLKQAAIFLALSKIYFNFSDTVDDKYSQKSIAFNDKYVKSINLARISLDNDEDGIADDHEVGREFTNIRIRR